MKARVAVVSLAALIIGVFVATRSADASTPRRPPGSYYFGPAVVWTDGSTGDVFQPISDPLPSSQLVSGRIYFEITEGTGSTNLRSRPALRYSADGVNWDTPTAINASYVSGSAIQAGTTFVDLSQVGTAKAFVQFGVQLHNNAAGVYELAHAVLIVEPKGN